MSQEAQVYSAPEETRHPRQDTGTCRPGTCPALGTLQVSAQDLRTAHFHPAFLESCVPVQGPGRRTWTGHPWTPGTYSAAMETRTDGVFLLDWPAPTQGPGTSEAGLSVAETNRNSPPLWARRISLPDRSRGYSGAGSLLASLGNVATSVQTDCARVGFGALPWDTATQTPSDSVSVVFQASLWCPVRRTENGPDVAKI